MRPVKRILCLILALICVFFTGCNSILAKGDFHVKNFSPVSIPDIMQGVSDSVDQNQVAIDFEKYNVPGTSAFYILPNHVNVPSQMAAFKVLDYNSNGCFVYCYETQYVKKPGKNDAGVTATSGKAPEKFQTVYAVTPSGEGSAGSKDALVLMSYNPATRDYKVFFSTLVPRAEEETVTNSAGEDIGDLVGQIHETVIQANRLANREEYFLFTADKYAYVFDKNGNGLVRKDCGSVLDEEIGRIKDEAYSALVDSGVSKEDAQKRKDNSTVTVNDAVMDQYYDVFVSLTVELPDEEGQKALEEESQNYDYTSDDSDEAMEEGDAYMEQSMFSTVVALYSADIGGENGIAFYSENLNAEIQRLLWQYPTVNLEDIIDAAYAKKNGDTKLYESIIERFSQLRSNYIVAIGKEGVEWSGDTTSDFSEGEVIFRAEGIAEHYADLFDMHNIKTGEVCNPRLDGDRPTEIFYLMNGNRTLADRTRLMDHFEGFHTKGNSMNMELQYAEDLYGQIGDLLQTFVDNSDDYYKYRIQTGGTAGLSFDTDELEDYWSGWEKFKAFFTGREYADGLKGVAQGFKDADSSERIDIVKNKCNDEDRQRLMSMVLGVFADTADKSTLSWLRPLTWDRGSWKNPISVDPSPSGFDKLEALLVGRTSVYQEGGKEVQTTRYYPILYNDRYTKSVASLPWTVRVSKYMEAATREIKYVEERDPTDEEFDAWMENNPDKIQAYLDETRQEYEDRNSWRGQSYIEENYTEPDEDKIKYYFRNQYEGFGVQIEEIKTLKEYLPGNTYPVEYEFRLPEGTILQWVESTGRDESIAPSGEMGVVYYSVTQEGDEEGDGEGEGDEEKETLSMIRYNNGVKEVLRSEGVKGAAEDAGIVYYYGNSVDPTEVTVFVTDQTINFYKRSAQGNYTSIPVSIQMSQLAGMPSNYAVTVYGENWNYESSSWEGNKYQADADQQGEIQKGMETGSGSEVLNVSGMAMLNDHDVVMPTLSTGLILANINSGLSVVLQKGSYYSAFEDRTGKGGFMVVGFGSQGYGYQPCDISMAKCYSMDLAGRNVQLEEEALKAYLDGLYVSYLNRTHRLRLLPGSTNQYTVEPLSVSDIAENAKAENLFYKDASARSRELDSALKRFGFSSLPQSIKNYADELAADAQDQRKALEQLYQFVGVGNITGIPTQAWLLQAEGELIDLDYAPGLENVMIQLALSDQGIANIKNDDKKKQYLEYQKQMDLQMSNNDRGSDLAKDYREITWEKDLETMQEMEFYQAVLADLKAQVALTRNLVLQEDIDAAWEEYLLDMLQRTNPNCPPALQESGLDDLIALMDTTSGALDRDTLASQVSEIRRVVDLEELILTYKLKEAKYASSTFRDELQAYQENVSFESQEAKEKAFRNAGFYQVLADLQTKAKEKGLLGSRTWEEVLTDIIARCGGGITLSSS